MKEYTLAALIFSLYLLVAIIVAVGDAVDRFFGLFGVCLLSHSPNRNHWVKDKTFCTRCNCKL